jgi:hypothetical protein
LKLQTSLVIVMFQIVVELITIHEIVNIEVLPSQSPYSKFIFL